MPADTDDPWRPITTAIDLKHLGKLAEECGELTQIIGRSICQGLNQRSPDTQKLNEDALEEEIADVLANIKLCTEHFNLNTEYITLRMNKKHAQLKVWHMQVREDTTCE